MRFQAVEVELDGQQRQALGVQIGDSVGVRGQRGAARVVEATSRLSKMAAALEMVVLNGMLADLSGRVVGPSSYQVEQASLTRAAARPFHLALVLEIPPEAISRPGSHRCAGTPR